MSIGSPGARRSWRTPLRVMLCAPASPSTYMKPSSGRVTMPCSSGTRGSARWISQLALRPTRSHCAVTAFFDWTRPPARMTIRTFIALPVDEHRDHVRQERGQQHEGERHVEVEPKVEQRLVAQVAPRLVEQLLLAQQ